MTRYFSVSNISDLSSLELHKLYKLRVDIFVYEQKTPYPEIDDVDAAATTRHVLAWQRRVDGPSTLDGCARLFPTTTSEIAAATGSNLELDDAPISQLGRLAVTRDCRGTGLSDEIMKNVLRLAYEQFPDCDVILTAQEPLRGFYEGYGFTVCGSAYDDSGTPHLPMVLKASELVRYAA